MTPLTCFVVAYAPFLKEIYGLEIHDNNTNDVNSSAIFVLKVTHASAIFFKGNIRVWAIVWATIMLVAEHLKVFYLNTFC